jgi:hypothetical protein
MRADGEIDASQAHSGSTVVGTTVFELSPRESGGGPQGTLQDQELEGLGLAIANTYDWKCSSPTQPRDCCVGGTVR